MRKSWTREELQKELEKNKCQVSYLTREGGGNPDNYIVYYRLKPGRSIRADGGVHMRKVLVQVSHFHKKKLDSIEGMILDVFGVEPTAFDVEQPDTNYFATHYRFEILTTGAW